ncbi:MAG: CCA tRNA nucleotidyltransferase [Eubacterium sp.]|nr:CCA tRNA nucleotidyltransferase [Eubacterium sp.]
MKMEIPEQVNYILEELEKAGYEAYAVGGCVRDSLLGKEPKDWDITTSAKPLEVKELFRRTIDTGIQHGTVTVMLGSQGFEVTTYRMDGEYEDHRHPKEVIFTPDLREDLKRRDFTINAMAYNPRTGIVDCFEGQEDLEKKVIRCVGNPVDRFDEDALRMLRGIRFAGQLGFEVEEKTLEAMKIKAPTLVNVSAERIRTELSRLLISARPDRLMLAVETGLIQYFLPEFEKMLETKQNNPHHIYDVGRHSMEAVIWISKLFDQRREEFADCPWPEEKIRTALAYAALLHDVGKPACQTVDAEGIHHFHRHPLVGKDMATDILKRLKFDNDTISMVSRIIAEHDCRHENCYIDGEYSPKGKKAMRRLIHRIGPEAMPFLFLLQEADLMAQSDYCRQEKLAKLMAGKRACREVLEAKEPVNIGDLALGGKDLIALGVKPGPEMGKILQKLLDRVLEDPELNRYEILKEIVDKMR